MTTTQTTNETSPRVRTVMFAIREALRVLSESNGGRVARITRHRDSKCRECNQPLYFAQLVCVTMWRPVTMGQARWAGSYAPVPIYTCGACALERVIAGKHLPYA